MVSVTCNEVNTRKTAIGRLEGEPLKITPRGWSGDGTDVSTGLTSRDPWGSPSLSSYRTLSLTQSGPDS